MDVLNWLLDSDPSIRWQVMRDLTDEPADAVAAERSRIATEGWGARLLIPTNAWPRRSSSSRPSAAPTGGGRSIRGILA